VKILFFASGDIGAGSYRIWVNDLNDYFRDCGYDSEIATSKTKGALLDYDVVICSKNDVETAIAVKKQFPNKKVGVINLAADKRDIPVDFVIVGSIEEMDSLSHYKNVFLFPLIENMYQGEDYKTHSKKSRLRIGFHGHYPHLSKFAPNLKRAIEEVDKVCDIELLVITSNTSFKWKVGKPNIENIIMKPWNIKTIKQDLLSCDIGIVPNVTHIPLDLNKHKTSTDLGLYNTDFIVRMKNKSNAGRAYVFHQLGIPVIADFTPSNFHVMGDPECGILANSYEGWKKGILRLCDANLRQKMADHAKREFDRLYSPYAWASKLYNDILGITYE
tara:strand:- start:4269 stop:5261 length:993 start_codon:yes stop_codon:yes gene_type:complete